MQVSKIKQMMVGDTKEGPVRPVIRTFYDHLQVSSTQITLMV
jgi:cleavage stimulation factor subunit 1